MPLLFLNSNGIIVFLEPPYVTSVNWLKRSEADEDIMDLVSFTWMSWAHDPAIPALSLTPETKSFPIMNTGVLIC